jgi:hypothetical protein
VPISQETCRDLGENFSRRIDYGCDHFSRPNPMRKVADHLRGRLKFEPSYSRATNYFGIIGRSPGTGCSDQPDRQASQAAPRLHSST